MPLSPAIEFLATQESSPGNKLCRLGMQQVIMVLPANTTVRFRVTPPRDIYALYNFRVMVDPIVVPGAFRIMVAHYGGLPLTGILFAGGLGYPHDTFIRVTHAQYSITSITNLTVLNQQFISYNQNLVVATEDDSKELERRLAIYYRQVAAEVEPVERQGRPPLPPRVF